VVVDVAVEDSVLVTDVLELVKGGSTVVDGGPESVVEDEGVEVGSLPKGGRGLPVVVNVAVEDSVLVTDVLELVTGGSTVVADGSGSVVVSEGMDDGSLSTGGRGVGPGRGLSVVVVDALVDDSVSVVELGKGGSTVVEVISGPVVVDEGVGEGSLPTGGRGVTVVVDVVVDDSELVVELVRGGSVAVGDGSESVVDDGVGDSGSSFPGGGGVELVGGGVPVPVLDVLVDDSELVVVFVGVGSTVVGGEGDSVVEDELEVELVGSSEVVAEELELVEVGVSVVDSEEVLDSGVVVDESELEVGGGTTVSEDGGDCVGVSSPDDVADGAVLVVELSIVEVVGVSTVSVELGTALPDVEAGGGREAGSEVELI
jgi:hypothetical protein